jgi:hypothetical protein
VAVGIAVGGIALDDGGMLVPVVETSGVVDPHALNRVIKVIRTRHRAKDLNISFLSMSAK